jgi:hypothetical protein
MCPASGVQKDRPAGDEQHGRVPDRYHSVSFVKLNSAIRCVDQRDTARSYRIDAESQDDQIESGKGVGQASGLAPAFSCSSSLIKSSKLKKRTRAPLRMQWMPMATLRCVFPVPVPPM